MSSGCSVGRSVENPAGGPSCSLHRGVGRRGRAARRTRHAPPSAVSEARETSPFSSRKTTRLCGASAAYSSGTRGRAASSSGRRRPPVSRVDASARRCLRAGPEGAATRCKCIRRLVNASSQGRLRGRPRRHPAGVRRARPFVRPRARGPSRGRRPSRPPSRRSCSGRARPRRTPPARPARRGRARA